MLAVLGEGGMGRVYRARMEGPDGFEKTVAVKVIAGGDDAGRRRAIVREARLGARVHHPNLVDVYDFGVADDQPWVAMELVEGPSLEAFLRTADAIPEDAARDLLLQLLRGLAALHGARSAEAPDGLVHLDLKPANVLLHPAGLAKITDLGLARAAGLGLDRPSGTPAYMAPEQAAARPVDGRSDLYAWGAIAWEVLLGERLVREDGFTALMATLAGEPRVTGHGADRLRAAAPTLAEPILACLERDPGRRPTSARELLGHLDRSAASAWVAAPGASETPTSTGPTPWTREWDTPTPDWPPPGMHPPPPPAQLYGRDGVVAELADRVALGAGVVALHGPAGSGKSAVALAYAADAASRFPGGVGYADLGAARTRAATIAGVAAAIGAVARGADPAAALGTALAGLGRALLILDDADAVADELALLLVNWCRAAPDLVVVVTSRVRPEVGGAVTILTVGPLDRPDPADDDLGAHPAVALLIDRARRRRAGWSPSPSDLPVLAELVGRLDGLPLALELAAARLAMVSPRGLLRRIDGALDLRARKGARSLRAALDAGWALLSPWARDALAQCTVFRGPFDVEAAEAVLDLGEHDDAPWPDEALDELVAQAWLQALPGEPPRFALLGAVRAYAAEQLADGDATRERHLEWFGGPSVEDRIDRARGVAGAEALAALIADRDELVAAVEEAVRRGRAPAAATAARALGATLEQLGPPDWVESVLQTALAVPGHSDRDRSELLRLVGIARTQEGRYEAADAVLREAMAASDDPVAVGLAQAELGRNWLQVRPNDEVEAMLAQARETLADHPIHAAHAQAMQATAVLGAGRLQEGIGLLRDAVGVLERHAPASRVAMHQLNLGLALDLVGRRDTAARVLREAEALARRAGSPRAEAAAALLLASRALQQGELDAAHTRSRRAVSRARRAGEATSLSWAERCRAEVAIARGELEDARLALAEAERVLGPEAASLHRGMADYTSGHWYLAAGDPDAAVRAYERALDHLRAVGEDGKVRFVTAHLVIAHWWRGDAPAAEAALARLDALPGAATGAHDAGWEALARQAVTGERSELVLVAGDPRLRAWTALIAGAAGDPTALAEAAAVVAKLGAGPDSLVAQAVKRARELAAG